ncbi:MAG: LysM domain-containing protein [Opitutus sp.]|nr:LysM domain-containing protein [Opitutus sp.]
MKIMKVLGVVAGIHVFALILIFANPGCSSTSKPTPAPIDTLAKPDAGPGVTVPGVSPGVAVPMGDSRHALVSAAPINFNPDAPATAAGGGVRFLPTRPGTPAASTLVAEPVADVTPATTYTVKAGDSLWTVANKSHLTVAELTAANSLKANATLHAGQKLLIPGKRTTPAATSAATAAKIEAAIPAKGPADSVKHIVKSGETLSTIAKKYDVKQGDIAVANNISDPQKIRAGLELTIPGWQNPAGKAPKPATKAAAPGRTTKPAVPEVKPLFAAPGAGQTPDISPKPAPAGGVPEIKVEEAPVEPKQKP